MAMTETNSNPRRSSNSSNNNPQRNKPWNNKGNNNGNNRNKRKPNKFQNKKNKFAVKDPNDRSAIGLPNKSPARFRSSLMAQSRIFNNAKLEDRIAILSNEGWTASFGTIGKHTTWCLLEKEDREIIGYTYVEKLESFDPELGKLRALTQATARKSLQDTERLLLASQKQAKTTK